MLLSAGLGLLRNLFQTRKPQHPLQRPRGRAGSGAVRQTRTWAAAEKAELPVFPPRSFSNCSALCAGGEPLVVPRGGGGPAAAVGNFLPGAKLFYLCRGEGSAGVESPAKITLFCPALTASARALLVVLPCLGARLCNRAFCHPNRSATSLTACRDVSLWEESSCPHVLLLLT